MKHLVRVAPTVAPEPVAPLAAMKVHTAILKRKKPISVVEAETAVVAAEAALEAAKANLAKAKQAAEIAVAPTPKKGLVRKPVEAEPVVSKVSDELRAKMHKDKFLMKAYHTAGELDKFIDDIDKVLSGHKKPLKGESRDYGRPVYDMGEFHSMKWPKNANNVSTPKATEKLIAELPGGKYELRIVTTGDSEAFGRYEEVFMALLG